MANINGLTKDEMQILYDLRTKANNGQIVAMRQLFQEEIERRGIEPYKLQVFGMNIVEDYAMEDNTFRFI